jgi:hypothetical protein
MNFFARHRFMVIGTITVVLLTTWGLYQSRPRMVTEIPASVSALDPPAAGIPVELSVATSVIAS